MTVIQYLKATPDDAALLSVIAQESKQNWGYPNEWMQLWEPELTLSFDYISKHHVYKIYAESELIGFYSIIDAQIAEVDHLWLTPLNQRKGYGAKIFAHIRNTVAGFGRTRFELVAEPHAKGFYEKMGGKSKSVFESKVPGRFLEIYEFEI